MWGLWSDYKLSRRGSWLGGFWAALWWRRAQASGDAVDVAEARTWSARLAAQLGEPSVNRSFVFWYGAGLAARQRARITGAQLAIGFILVLDRKRSMNPTYRQMKL
ncbi:hypothetical protein [Pseudomonas putida]|uniref:hypothetical protein n=1 Tax=Pseudomonas putida TaxID=303 RepID=UPI000DFC18C8|nr:hypothetical protein [Pseudomonas putida]SUD78357.1 unsaturated glucuronyl hydrolase [Pseudomonas putida]